jgi:anti-anti-sigma factor
VSSTYEDGGPTSTLVVSPRGELDLAVVADLERLLGSVPCEENLIVDLAEATFIDSVTLSLFVRTARCHTDSGSMLVLAAPAPIVQRVLVTTRLDDVLRCADTVDEAHAFLGPVDGQAL